MPGKHWIDELIDNGTCYLCKDKFYYYKNKIKKHKSLLVLKGIAYCSPCGEMICEMRRNNA